MQVNPSWILALQGIVWVIFLGARLLSLSAQPDPAEPTVSSPVASPQASRVIFLHGAAFFILYFGMFSFLGGDHLELFAPQQLAATLLIALAALVMVSTMLVFRSWRFRAELAEGHQLVTGGPFRLVRHPIYLGLDLLALATALWAPTPIVWTGFLLMCVTGDLRARVEEKLLSGAFGDAYRDYCARTARFLPKLY